MPTASLQRVKTQNNECPGYDTELHLMVRLQSWSFEECVLPLNAIIPRYTLTRSDSTCLDHIYGLNKTV